MTDGGRLEAKDYRDARSMMRRWAAMHNLGSAVRYFETVDRLLAADLAENDAPEELAALEYHRTRAADSALLLLCSAVEEALHDLSDEPETTEATRNRSGLRRYKPTVAALVDLDAAQWWEELHDVFQVRHCLLHANGRIDRMRPAGAKVVRRFLDRGLLEEWTGRRILVRRGFVIHAANVAAEAVDALASATGWTGSSRINFAALDGD